MYFVGPVLENKFEICWIFLFSVNYEILLYFLLYIRQQHNLHTGVVRRQRNSQASVTLLNLSPFVQVFESRSKSKVTGSKVLVSYERPSHKALYVKYQRPIPINSKGL